MEIRAPSLSLEEVTHYVCNGHINGVMSQDEQVPCGTRAGTEPAVEAGQ